MDAFEDGKFPLGTDCTFGSSKSFCVDGKCLKFDEKDFPLDPSKIFPLFQMIPDNKDIPLTADDRS